MPESSVLRVVFWLFAAGIAVGVSALLTRWSRRLWRAIDPADRVEFLGAYSPLLTMLKQRRLALRRQPAGTPPAPDQTLPAAAAPVRPEAGPEVKTCLGVSLAGALILLLLGQYIWTTGQDLRRAGLPYLIGALLFLLLGNSLHRRGALPGWYARLAGWLGLRPFQPLLLVLAAGAARAAAFFAGDAALMSRPAEALIAWGASWGLLLAATLGRPAEPAVSPPSGDSPAWSRIELAGLVTLAVAAFLLRAVANGSIPAALNGDEGSTGLSAVDILQGRLNNPFSVGWYSFPSLYFFIPAASIAVGGQTFAALRMPSAIAGALTVVGLYWLARPLFGRRTALVAAALLTASNFHIHFSRIGLNNIWDGCFAVWTLGAFWRGWRSGRGGYFVAAGILLGLSQHFYPSARLILLLVLLWAALEFLSDRARARARFPGMVILALALTIVVLPAGLFFLRHQDEFMAPMRRFTILSSDWLSSPYLGTAQPLWLALLVNVRDAFLGFTNTPMRYWYPSGQPMLLTLPSAFFLAGLVLALLEARKTQHAILLLWLAGVAAIGALTDSAPASQRYVIGAPAAALLAGFGLSRLLDWADEAFPGWRRALAAGGVVLVVWAMLGDLRFYFREYVPHAGYGDMNTQVASRLGESLRSYPPNSTVYFFGAPRMGYYGFSTIPFLAPQVTGIDINDPLLRPPDWQLSGRSLFVLLPERIAELSQIVEAYPAGRSARVFNHAGELLYLAYEVDSP